MVTREGMNLMIDETNCTVFFTNGTVRAKIIRVINPDNVATIELCFSEGATRYFTNVQLDIDGRFMGSVPAYLMKPDDDVKSINWYYCIGKSLDACPYSINGFEWRNQKQKRE